MGPVDISASATFATLAGDELQITLVNTSPYATVAQSDVLTGIFFSGADGLTPVSATAGAGSVQWQGGVSSAPDPPSVIGENWAYGTASGAPGEATSGINSSGAWNQGPGQGNFASPGANLDGSSYGLLSAGYAGATPDGLDGRVYIQNTMVFVLSGWTGSLSDISNVSFQYGTSLSEPNLTAVAVPEPIALTPGALLLAALWVSGRRRLGRFQ